MRTKFRNAPLYVALWILLPWLYLLVKFDGLVFGANWNCEDMDEADY